MRWVLARPDTFLNTSSDGRLLRPVLEEASQSGEAPSDDAMRDDETRRELARKVNGYETIKNQRLKGSWSLYIARRWYVTPFAIELYRDPLQNIDLRTTPLAGGGYYIFKKGVGEQAVVDWDVSALLGYQRTEFQSGDSRSTTATRPKGR